MKSERAFGQIRARYLFGLFYTYLAASVEVIVILRIIAGPRVHVVPRINVLGLARRDIRHPEAHDDHLLTAETAATQPATHPAVQARYLLCNVVPHTVVLDEPRVKRSIWSGACSYLPVRSRCLHPGQQQGRRMPSSSSSWVRRMRRFRVTSCLASSTQQMNSLRASGVMSFHAASTSELAISASRRSAGKLCTTPPGTRWLLTAASVTRGRRRPFLLGPAASVGNRLTGEAHASNQSFRQPSCG